MFTGIIEATGTLIETKSHGSDLSVKVQSHSLDFSDVKLGDSIATNGVCLTVTALGPHWYSADLSTETLANTCFAHYKVGQVLNLEKALLPTTRLGGHLVSGHVDAVSHITKVQRDGRAWQVWVAMPAHLARYIAAKGSITVDGISLTVNELATDAFRLTIVPHTVGQTTMASWSLGSKVHLEVDVLARYLERLMQPATTPSSGVTMDLLQQNGFL